MLIDRFAEYCCRDSHATLLSAFSLMQELREAEMEAYYEKYVQRAAEVVLAINAAGLHIDTGKKHEAIATLNLECEALQEKINTEAGQALNINGDSMRVFLFGGKGSINTENLLKVQKLPLRKMISKHF